MLGLARTSEHRLGVLVRPALELGDGTSRSLPRRISRSSGWTWRSKESSDMPSDIAASWRLRATRGTLLDAVLTATSS